MQDVVISFKEKAIQKICPNAHTGMHLGHVTNVCIVSLQSASMVLPSKH